MLVTVFTAIFVFGLLVFFHELGHFAVAKKAGIKVHEFALGIGPKLFKVKKGETVYSIRILPIGGFVKMEGEDGNSDDDRSFGKKSVVTRMSVIFAGSLMNFILGILLFMIIFYQLGFPSTTIENVIQDSPAQKAGIQQNDRILSINDIKINNWNQVIQEINRSEGKPVAIVLSRDKDTIRENIVPVIDEETNRAMIGIVPRVEKSILLSLDESLRHTGMIFREIFNFFGRLIMGRGGAEDVAGPLGIISLVGEASRTGWMNVFFLAAVISINLGIMNLLPIPALDGSRIVFLFLELLRGKPVDPEKEGFVHMIGFAVLMVLMVLITYKDIMKFSIFD